MSDDAARQFPTLWIAASGEAIIREEQFWTEAIACFHALQKAQAQLAAAEQRIKELESRGT